MAFLSRICWMHITIRIADNTPHKTLYKNGAGNIFSVGQVAATSKKQRIFSVSADTYR